MKKCVIICLLIIVVVAFYIILAMPRIGTDKDNYALTYQEFQINIDNAKQKNDKAISILLAYYSIYKNDSDAAWLVVCHGKEMNISYLIDRWESKHEIYPECPEEPLNQLKY